jgi:hypothetical protein
VAAQVHDRVRGLPSGVATRTAAGGCLAPVMSNLPRHYGTDVSLDSAAVKELSTWLSANAATSRSPRDAPPEDRITRSAWFIHQHDDVPAAT